MAPSRLSGPARNVLILAAAQALSASGMMTMTLLGGILGAGWNLLFVGGTALFAALLVFGPSPSDRESRARSP